MRKHLILSLLIALFTVTILYAADEPSDKQAIPEKYGVIISKTPLIEKIDHLARLAGYRVVYEYAGKQYSVLMPDDPGSQVVILVPPTDANPVPTIRMNAAVPIKPPTAAEVEAATTRPIIIESIYFPLLHSFPFGYWDPHYLYQGYYWHRY